MLRNISLLALLVIMCTPSKGVAQANCEEISFESGNVIMSAQISGYPVDALLTLSAVPVAIPRPLADALSISYAPRPSRLYLNSAGDRTRLNVVYDLAVNVFGNTIHYRDVPVTDAEDSTLILSLQSFSQLLVNLDFPSGQLCLFNENAIDLIDNQNIDIDYNVSGSRPVVNVTLNDEESVWLEFAPEYQGGVLLDPIIAREVKINHRNSAEASDQDTPHRYIEQLQFGPYRLFEVPVELTEPGALRGQRKSYRQRKAITGSIIKHGKPAYGKVGMAVLKHFEITIDLNSQRMHVYAPDTATTQSNN